MSAMTVRRALAALVGLVFFAMSLPAAACDLSCLFHVKQNSRCELAANDSKGDSNGSNAAMAAQCAHCGAARSPARLVTAKVSQIEQPVADGPVPAPRCGSELCGLAAAMVNAEVTRNSINAARGVALPAGRFDFDWPALDGRGLKTAVAADYCADAAPLFVALRI